MLAKKASKRLENTWSVQYWSDTATNSPIFIITIDLIKKTAMVNGDILHLHSKAFKECMERSKKLMHCQHREAFPSPAVRDRYAV